MHVDTISSLAIGCWLALVLGGEELNRLLQLICCVVSPHALTDLFIHPFIYLFCRRYSLERVLALTKSKTRNTKQAQKREHFVTVFVNHMFLATVIPKVCKNERLDQVHR